MLFRCLRAFVSDTSTSVSLQSPTPNFQLDEGFPSKKMRESENMLKTAPGSKQRSLNADDSGQPGSASWISIRSESTLRFILVANVNFN